MSADELGVYHRPAGALRNDGGAAGPGMLTLDRLLTSAIEHVAPSSGTIGVTVGSGAGGSGTAAFVSGAGSTDLAGAVSLTIDGGGPGPGGDALWSVTFANPRRGP